MTSKKLKIISEKGDHTTNVVLKWLLKNNVVFNRVDCDEAIDFCIKIDNEESSIKIDNGDYRVDEYWIRRGGFQFLTTKNRNSVFENYLKKEQIPVLSFIEKTMTENDNLVGSYLEEKFNNKILNIKIASSLGLKIPETLITNTKKELVSFFNLHTNIVSKCIYHDPNIQHNDYEYLNSGNQLVKEEQIQKLEEEFAPSIFQRYIEKKYEVRVFVFKDSLYSMAIFSQNDEKTKYDFRNYNKETPNRNIPYKLPKKIIKKIMSFMKVKNMNSGSIDLIVDEKNDFYFLEINPQGQIDWLSINCNYYIEKSIAENYF